MDLSAATPVEIDTLIADIFERAAVLVPKIASAQRDMEYAENHVGHYGITLASAKERAARFNAAVAERQTILAETEPFDAEFDRRGGWTRAFLVRNAGGHIHRSMGCSTCYITTEFGWLPQVSGHAEAEIVAGAGEGACTVCYPSAPVETAGPRTLLHKDEIAEQAARAERAAAKQAREAAKAAKALGTVVRGPHGRIETIAAAKSFLTDAYEWGVDKHPYYPAALVDEVAQAVSLRTGKSADTEKADAEVRAIKRRQRNAR